MTALRIPKVQYFCLALQVVRLKWPRQPQGSAGSVEICMGILGQPRMQRILDFATKPASAP
jgi:hypothetical protein